MAATTLPHPPYPDHALRWLAGLVDGEGSVMLQKRTFSGNTLRTTYTGKGDSYRPVVVVANTDTRLHAAILAEFGFGQVYEHRYGGARATHKRQYTWRMNVAQLTVMLPLLRPWFVLKGEQVDLLVEAMAIKATRDPARGGMRLSVPELELSSARLDEIYGAIRALNKTGRVRPDTMEVVPSEQ